MMDAMTTDEGELVLPDLTPAAGRILDAAAELFYLHGIHAVGVDTIAAASGVTKRTLYDRFGSKDVLVATYLRARHVAWWARLDERLEVAPAPRALAVFDAYAEDAPSVERGCAFLNAAGELPADSAGQRRARSRRTNSGARSAAVRSRRQTAAAR